MSSLCGEIVFSIRYQFLSVVHCLQVLLFPFIGLVLLLQVRFNRLVLGIEVAHVLRSEDKSALTS